MKACDEDLIRRIRNILEHQRLAVLATEGDEGPYANIVSFTPSRDLKTLLFATSRSTRKFSNLMHSTKVSLLVDNRSNRIEDFSDAVAITAMGSAREVQEKEKERALELILEIHPHLKTFLRSPSIAVMEVMVHKYIMVCRFQEVREVIFHEKEDNSSI